MIATSEPGRSGSLVAGVDVGGTKTSIVTFRLSKDPAELSAALTAARVDVTVREHEVRVSPALFNTEDDIDGILAVTRGRA